MKLLRPGAGFLAKRGMGIEGMLIAILYARDGKKVLILALPGYVADGVLCIEFAGAMLWRKTGADGEFDRRDHVDFTRDSHSVILQNCTRRFSPHVT